MNILIPTLGTVLVTGIILGRFELVAPLAIAVALILDRAQR